jgi:hypothetical protein
LENLKKCKQDSCPVAQDGKCLEGLEPSECPHFYVSESGDGSVVSTIETSKKDGEIHLFSGDELLPKEASLITYQHSYTLVGIIGNHDCGKTTLLATIYDMLQEAPIENTFCFTGSYTQIGFEKRSHLSRFESGLNDPTTEHTTNPQITLLHLALKRLTELAEPAKHILLTDVKGERFEAARKSKSAMAELDLISRCSYILVILDGKKLADPTEKHATIEQMKWFLKMAIEEKIITSENAVKIVISKWDLIENSTTFDFKVEIEESFTKAFGQTLSGLSFAKIASRPMDAESPIVSGYGIFSLIEEWMAPQKNHTIGIQSDFEFDRYFSSYRHI